MGKATHHLSAGRALCGAAIEWPQPQPHVDCVHCREVLRGLEFLRTARAGDLAANFSEGQEIMIVDRLVGEFEVDRVVVERMLQAARKDAVVARVEHRRKGFTEEIRLYVPVVKPLRPSSVIRFNRAVDGDPWHGPRTIAGSTPCPHSGKLTACFVRNDKAVARVLMVCTNCYSPVRVLDYSSIAVSALLGVVTADRVVAEVPYLSAMDVAE